MNKKNIKNLLMRKHTKFIDSIEDDVVKEAVRNNSFITGGAIVSMLLDENINDYDYYFTNKETVLLVAEYYVDKFNMTNNTKVIVKQEDDNVSVYVPSIGIAGAPEGHEIDEQEEDIYDYGSRKPGENEPVFLSTNAISLKGGVQLVLRFYGEPEEIHENYDFAHTKNYWKPNSNELILSQTALEAIITKELIYTGSKYPVASLFRTRKFIKRGWSIDAGQYLKIALQISQLNLMDPAVLEDQLTGVDAAYFQIVLNEVKAVQESNADFEITVDFLIDTINKVFQ